MDNKYFQYKSNYYRFIRFVQVKNQETREWDKCVEYRQVLKGNDDIYVRNCTDFAKKFKPVEREELIGK